MRKSRRNADVADNAFLPGKLRRRVPFEFVLEALSSLSPYTRPMFGCTAVYVADKIVLILRDKPNSEADNGVWLATTKEHHESLHQDFPNLRSIQVLGAPVTGWQVLPADAPDFEAAATRACELILARDPRIGKVPAGRRPAVSRSMRKLSKPSRSSSKPSGRGTT